MWRGIIRIREKTGISAMPKRNMKIVARKVPPKMPTTTSGLVWKSMGPGARPWIISPPMSTAVTTSPGTPRARSGMSAAAQTALLALSVAQMPGAWPVPNFSGVFEARRASL